MQRRTTALYFSPTGRARTYVRAVAVAIPHMGGGVDPTRPEERCKVHMSGADDVVVLGVPVYYGQVPEVPGLLDGLQEEETPAVLLAVYGNRLIDNALAELNDLYAARGFHPLAAGAFVASHTLSAKIAMERPNTGDLTTAAELGRRVAEKLLGPWYTPELPGNWPYRSFQRVPFYPAGNDIRTRCGCYVGACPVEATHPATPRATDGEKCIRCLACVRACPAGSRRVEGPAFAATVVHLEEALTKEDKPPELYLRKQTQEALRGAPPVWLSGEQHTIHAAAGEAGVTAPDIGSRNDRPGPSPHDAGIEKGVRDGPID